jgi:hypothetical protein
MTAQPGEFTFASIPAFVADDDEQEIREPQIEPSQEVPRGQNAMRDADFRGPAGDCSGRRCDACGRAA